MKIITILHLYCSHKLGYLMGNLQTKTVALTYDDIGIKPRYSEIESRSQVSLRSRIIGDIHVCNPFMSSPMSTISGAKMGIALALKGSVAVLHRNCSIDEQWEMVNAVKTFTNSIIEKPKTIPPNTTMKQLFKEIIPQTKVSCFPIVTNENKLLGLLTKMNYQLVDLNEDTESKLVIDYMTPFPKLVVGNPNMKQEEMVKIMNENKVAKLPLINDKEELCGLVTSKDILLRKTSPTATLDKKGRLVCGAAVGVVGDYIERTAKLVEAGVDFICLDVAHAHHKNMLIAIKNLKGKFPQLLIMAGNICTAEGAEYLINCGADAIRVGIGNGCFAAGTRILMANGIYKNIEEVKIDDYVINVNGDPVKVTNAFSTGVRNVMKVRTNCFYQDTYVTPDHRFWIGDLSTIKDPRKSGSIAKKLDTFSIFGYQKYKFSEIGHTDPEKKFTLTPNNIKWQLPDTFTIDLSKYVIKAEITDETIKSDDSSNTINRILTPSYELGYLFGSYLGDGNVNNNSICWSYGLDEIDICKKTIECIKKIFNFDSTYARDNVNQNVNKIYVYNKYIMLLFAEFGKKQDKHLPNEYYCLNKEYAQGIVNGLIDSDGSIDKKKKETHSDRYCFNNTSTYLIELFNWCCMLLGNAHSNIKSKITAVELKDCNVENCKQGYRATIINEPRFTKNYIFSYILEQEETTLNVPVYDLTVDCPTHTFIANGVIVHNSICSTRMKTGCGTPQLTAVMECSSVAKKYDIPVIADGGHGGKIGNIAKALVVGGAAACMLGNFFAATDETPGIPVMKDGKSVKIFMGEASYSASHKENPCKPRKNIEGTESIVLCKGPVAAVIEEIEDGLRSSFSYLGVSSFEELRKIIVDYYIMTESGKKESGYHGVNVI